MTKAELIKLLADVPDEMRDLLNARSSGLRYKVFRVRGRYFVGTDSDWLLAVS